MYRRKCETEADFISFGFVSFIPFLEGGKKLLFVNYFQSAFVYELPGDLKVCRMKIF